MKRGVVGKSDSQCSAGVGFRELQCHLQSVRIQSFPEHSVNIQSDPHGTTIREISASPEHGNLMPNQNE